MTPTEIYNSCVISMCAADLCSVTHDPDVRERAIVWTMWSYTNVLHWMYHAYLGACVWDWLEVSIVVVDEDDE